MKSWPDLQNRRPLAFLSAGRFASKPEPALKKNSNRSASKKIKTPPVLLKRFATILAFVMALGCGSKNPTPPKKTSAEKGKPQAFSPAPETKISEKKKEPEKEPEEAADQPPSPERILFLTPGGPLVADVVLSIEGLPHDKLLKDLLDRVLAAADTDLDGHATWQEWKDNETFFQEELTEGSTNADRQVDQWIKKYDENHDQQMQTAEAAAWLGRDANGSARAFAVRSSRSYVINLASSSRVWQLLDHDHDGVLSEKEIQRAPTRFWSLDANDDRTITSAELASLREQLEMAGGQSFRANQSFSRHAAIHLDPSFERDRLDPLLSDLYAPRQSLTPKSFPDLPGLFANLDTDKNKRLDQAELAELFNVAPLVKLSIAFNEPDATSATVTVNVDNDNDFAANIGTATQLAANRVLLSLGKTRLILFADDLATDDRPIGRSQLRLMVHDQCDSLFQELDSDGDARLGEREIENSAKRLLRHDANGDRLLTSSEIPYAMIAAFFRGEPSNLPSFYLPNIAASISHGKRTLSWFERADFNGDRDLSRREFLGSAERFSKLDLNRDGYINHEEALGAQVD